MKLTLGISPCPNDTFIFDALIHHKIDTEGLDFEVMYVDVEQLNKWALNSRLDVSKLSYSAFVHCFDKYVLLDSGSALGRNCGPILIKKKETILTNKSRILIPGNYTTANMLLQIAYPYFTNKVETLFSDIEEILIVGKADAGLIIHENRFTYQYKGLEKVRDLGEFWEEETGLPIPLGGIVVNRDLPYKVQKKIERVLRRSIEFAFKNTESSSKFVKFHSQQMEKEVVDFHIRLYVNKFSLSLGEEGRSAVRKIFDVSNHQNPINDVDIFL